MFNKLYAGGVKSKSRKAFTLAELLTTMAVIGIVASLTIPTLTKSYQQQVFTSKALKALSVISQATMELKADNGGTIVGYFSSREDMLAKYRTKLKLVKECAAGSGDCWADGTTILNSNNYVDGSQSHYYAIKPTAIGADGASYSFGLTDSNCSSPSVRKNGEYIYCGGIYVDVNGKKKPNKYGIDTFTISITKYDVQPRGADEHYGDANPLNDYSKFCNPSGGDAGNWNGVSCLAKIIEDGRKMTYWY